MDSFSVQRTNKTSCEIALDVEIASETIVEKINEAVKTFTKSVALPGFRKGKAPISMVRRMYHKYIVQGLTEDLIKEFYPKALEQEKIIPINQGQIESTSDVEEGKPFTFKVNVECKPEFEVKNYTGIEAKQTTTVVTDVEIEKVIEQIRNENAIISSVNGAVEKGHLVTIDLQRLDENEKPIADELLKDIKIEIGKSEIISLDFNLSLIGKKINDSGTYVHSYPNDFEDEELAGTSEKFSYLIKEIEQKELPELDDDFAKDLGAEITSLEVLKIKIKERLISEAKNKDEQSVINQIIEEIIKRNPIDAPKTFVNNFIHNLEHDLKERGEMPNIDHHEFHNHYQGLAVSNVKWALIREKLMEQENLVLTDEEVEAKIKELSEASENPTRTKVFLKTEKQNEALRNQMTDEKFVAFLKSISVIKEGNTEIQEAKAE
ncbi:trigger factor [bacterium]|nr:trigger factor [bacterium]